MIIPPALGQKFIINMSMKTDRSISGWEIFVLRTSAMIQFTTAILFDILFSNEKELLLYLELAR